MFSCSLRSPLLRLCLCAPPCSSRLPLPPPSELAFPGPRSPTPNFYSPPTTTHPTCKAAAARMEMSDLRKYCPMNEVRIDGCVRGGRQQQQSDRCGGRRHPYIHHGHVSSWRRGPFAGNERVFGFGSVRGTIPTANSDFVFLGMCEGGGQYLGVPGLAQDRHEKGGRYE